MTVRGNALVAAKVRGIAAEQRFTQADVAKILKTSRMAVSRRFSGQTPYTPDELVALADAFKVPVGAFFGEVPAVRIEAVAS